jgi:rhodanese-related sulfurtransferase
MVPIVHTSAGISKEPACPRERTPHVETTTSEIHVEELTAAAEGGTLVAVREPGDYVPGAVLMPMGEPANRRGEINKTAPVFVTCASGNRSGAMTDLLRGAGFDAVSVAGGTTGARPVG